MKQFTKFLVIGGFNTVIGLLVMFLGLNLLHFSYWVSTFLGNSIGAIVSYFLNRHFTFNNNGSILKTGFLFAAVILFCYLFAFKLGLYGARILMTLFPVIPQGIYHNAAILIGTVLYTVTNFVGQKFIVFNQKGRTGSKEGF